MNRRIFAVSFLILFLQILLIRWLADEVIILSHLRNLVLLAAFCGCGLGCCASQRRCFLAASAAALGALVVLVRDPFHVWSPFQKASDLLVPWLEVAPQNWAYWPSLGHGDVAVWTYGLLLLMTTFAAVGFIFFPLGQLLGRRLREQEGAVHAYTANLAGSLAGIWVFSGLCWSWLPPVVWFAVALTAFFLVAENRAARLASLLVLAVAVLATARPDADCVRTVWSPFHKLSLCSDRSDGGYTLRVGRFAFQSMLDLGRPGKEWQSSEQRWFCLPWKLRPSDSVLVLGAGCGNDVAGALQAGAPRVVAVDIDPAIVDLGRHYHPAKPYQDARVKTVIQDGRAYLRTCQEKFDVICFARLGFPAQASMFSNLGLEYYLHTLESFQDARTLLKPGGIMLVGVGFCPAFISTRVRDALIETFNTIPLILWADAAGSRLDLLAQHYFVAGNAATLSAIWGTASRSAEFTGKLDISSGGELVNPSLNTDDWPYLLLRTPEVPPTVLLSTVMIALMLTLLPRLPLGSGPRPYWPFFFLGGGFMLLEVHSISECMLLFGSTWSVHTYVITSVLLLACLANITHTRIPAAWMPLCYLLLLLALASQVVTPISVFAGLPLGGMMAALFLSLPLYFSGLIFIEMFCQTAHRDRALGWNFLGATMGGLLQSAAYVTGLRLITVVVMILYLLSWVSFKAARNGA